uniref:hypothetical protein n=1 Tax=Roseovarius indicus TaxID=540747 RepID=UPI003B521D04
MPEHVESVNSIATFFQEQAKESAPQWRERFVKYAGQLKAASEELVRLYGLTSALPPDLGNVHDLPSDLLEELSIAKSDDLEDQLVTVINAYGGEASLDQILVGLYRKFNVVQKRRFVQNKLYRMEMVWSVEGKKGVYTTTEVEDIISEPSDNGSRVVSGRNSIEYDDEIPF